MVAQSGCPVTGHKLLKTSQAISSVIVFELTQRACSFVLSRELFNKFGQIVGDKLKSARIVKSSPSQIIINPPPRFSPEVITEDPVGEANLKVNNRTAPSQELPEFSAGKMRSMSKIKTLGIAV